MHKALLPAGPLSTIGPSQTRTFRGSTPSRSALPVTIAPRLLSCLRIKHSVTTAPARLDSRPVANGYLDRLPTYKTMQPCQAATKGVPIYPLIFPRETCLRAEEKTRKGEPLRLGSQKGPPKAGFRLRWRPPGRIRGRFSLLFSSPQREQGPIGSPSAVRKF